MQAIATLMQEHRLIERAIDALVAFVDGVARAAGDERPRLGRFVTFIREFADAGHHGKEEDVLFRLMVEGGFPSQGGPIAVMLHEHVLGRAFVVRLAERAAQPGPWSAADREELAGAAHGYADLLREHIQKEDEILYPMAEARLPPALQERVDQECRVFDERRVASGEAARLRQLGDELLARPA